MNETPFLARDVFMRHTDTEGRTHVHCHRVWNAQLFLSSQQQDAERMNREAADEGKPTKAKAEQITEEQFTKEKTR